ncbi:MAG: hypothetical protein ACR2JD_02875 [Nocardioides sp.]
MGPVTFSAGGVRRPPALLRSALSPLMGVVLATAMVIAALGVPTGTAGDRIPAPALELRSKQLPSAQLTTFTFNVCFCLSAAQAEADMVRAFTLGDVGGLQEFSDLEDRQTLIRLATERDWGWYMPAVGGGETIPIIFNRARFRLISGETIKVHDAETNVTPARYINIVRLREIATNKVFGIINTHTIAQASFDAQLSDMSRIPRLRLHLKMLHDAIVGLFGTTEHVFAMGDLNVNYLADRQRQNEGLPTSALGGIVNFDMPLTGSRGATSLLDYGMTVKENSGLHLVGSRIEPGFNSDHDPVVFTYGTVDLFETGGIFNRPTGTASERNEVMARAVRAVGDAEAGARIRLAVTRLDDLDLMNALIAAATRGVAVQVVLAEGSGTYAEQTLATTLGLDTLQPSWVKKCVGSCLGGAGKTAANFLLVSRSGGATEVSLALAGSPQGKTAQRWTDGFMSTDTYVYTGYDQTFEVMATDATDTRAARQVTWGPSYAAQLYPLPEGAKDPMLKTLKRVRCKSGKAVVRATVAGASGARGQALAEQLGKLRAQGCDVRAVLGKQATKKIEKILTQAKIGLERRPVAQNVVFLKGTLGKGQVTRAWLGGPDWTDNGLTADGVTLIVNDGSAKDYLRQFYRVWKGK